MEKLPIEDRVKRLRQHGFNPIHLWGNAYLIRFNSTMVSDLPFYTIKILKE